MEFAEGSTLPGGHPGIDTPIASADCVRRTFADAMACMFPWEPPASEPERAKQAAQIDTAIEQEICRALQIDVLGRMEDGSVKIFSTFHRRSACVKNPSKMSYEDFCQICGPPAKACLLKSRVDDQVQGMYGVDDARTAIQLLAGYRTLSDEIELGCGCWQGNEDEDKSHEAMIVVNTGEAAIYNGSLRLVEYPRACGMLLDFSTGGGKEKRWYEFDRLKANIEGAENHDFRMAVYRDSLELFGRWRWAFQDSSPAILTGLCLATWVQHVWAWRPQVAIVGPSKSGKSFLCDGLAGLFRGNCILASDTTAAGLRQQIENSMPAVIVDEADPKDRGQQAERRRILAMIRQASRGGLVLRGSSSQKAVRHTLKHLFWIFGIQLPFDDEADRNRVIMLELRLPETTAEGKLHLPSPDKLADLGQRMLGLALWSCQRAKVLATRLRDCRIPGIDSRLIESYAVPAAILATLHGFDTDEEKTKEIMAEMLAEAAASDQPQATHDSLMEEILSARIQIGGERPSVSQCLERVEKRTSGAGEAEIALAAVGIKINEETNKKKQSLTIQYQPVAKHLLKGTRWDGAAIDQILRTIPEALRARQRIGGIKQRGIEIEWSVLVKRYFGKDESEKDANNSEKQSEF